MVTKPNFQLRGDLVLVRKQKRGIVRGLAMPERSAEGMDFFVEGFGPDVQDLKLGDQIMLMGKGTEQFYPCPGYPNHLVAKQELVAYVILPEDGDKEDKLQLC